MVKIGVLWRVMVDTGGYWWILVFSGVLNTAISPLSPLFTQNKSYRKKVLKKASASLFVVYS